MNERTMKRFYGPSGYVPLPGYVPLVEAPLPNHELTREQIVTLIDKVGKYYSYKHELTDLKETDAALRASRDEHKRKYEELEEWRRIILGTGTDQEAVIRLAAAEYTKVAVESWRLHVADIEQERDALKADKDSLYQANVRLVKAYDAVMGTPCEQIRHAEQVADITRQLGEARERVNELEEKLKALRESVERHRNGY